MTSEKKIRNRILNPHCLNGCHNNQKFQVITEIFQTQTHSKIKRTCNLCGEVIIYDEY